MNPNARKFTALVLLGLLALSAGVCSLAFTPTAISTLWPSDSLARSIGMLAMILSGVGYLICGLSIWGMVRLARGTPTEPPSPPLPL